MLFNINDIDKFFTELFKKLGEAFSLATLGVLLVGITIGFIMCASIYGILMVVSIRKEEKVRKDINLNIEPNHENIKSKIVELKDKFILTTEGLTIKERFNVLGSTIMETINIVASEYYPNSKYPIYELSIEELIGLLHYISTRIEGIFNKTLLRPFKKMTVSQILRFIELKKQISEQKIVKAVTNEKVGKVRKILTGILNYANPVYWFKKLALGTTINMALKKVCLVIIDIVCDETNKTYSKAIFDKESKLYQVEVETELENLKKEVEHE